MAFLGIDFGCLFESIGDAKIPERECVLPILSKLIGYCLVAASTTVKLPQIMKILKKKSVRGLSTLSFELEVVGYTIALSYCLHKGIHFSVYGELVFLLIQGIALVAIIYHYSQPGIKAWITPLLYFAFTPMLLTGKVDPVLFEALYASQHAIFFSARVPQIWKNFTNKSSGQLSFLTYLINFGASWARVFISIQEKAPASVVFGTLRALTTNSIILVQIIVYRQSQEDGEKKVK